MTNLLRMARSALSRITGGRGRPRATRQRRSRRHGSADRRLGEARRRFLVETPFMDTLIDDLRKVTRA